MTPHQSGWLPAEANRNLIKDKQWRLIKLDVDLFCIPLNSGVEDFERELAEQVAPADPGSEGGGQVAASYLIKDKQWNLTT